MESSTSLKQKGPHLAKVIIVGGSRVGKTSIIRRFTEDNFSTYDIATLGMDYKSKLVKLEDTEIKLQIWDTVGQEKFRSMAKNFFKGALGAIFVLDLSNEQSLEITRGWIAQCNMNMDEDTCKILVANKLDLTDERKISDDELAKIFREYQIPHMKASALTGENINEVFMAITRDIKRTFIDHEDKRDKTKTFSLLEPPSELYEKKKCC